MLKNSTYLNESFKKLLKRSLLFFYVLANVTLHGQAEVDSVLNNILKSNRRDTVLLQNMTVKGFKNKLYVIETGGLKKPYQAVNRFGYSGKYQLSRTYIRKYSQTDYETFLKSPWIQERTMNRLCAHYLSEIRQRRWYLYIGKEITGVTITLEGLMAGYHQHPVALKKWLESDGKIDLTDGNGYSVSRFVKHYSQ